MTSGILSSLLVYSFTSILVGSSFGGEQKSLSRPDAESLSWSAALADANENSDPTPDTLLPVSTAIALPLDQFEEVRELGHQQALTLGFHTSSSTRAPPKV